MPPLLQRFIITTQEPAEPNRLLEVNTRENREGGVDQGAAGAAGPGGGCPQGEGGLEGNAGTEVGGREGEKDGEEGGEREQNGEEGGTGIELMEEERRCCPQEVS